MQVYCIKSYKNIYKTELPAAVLTVGFDLRGLMRRKDRQVTDFDKMIEIMQKCDCCRLGLWDGSEVYIVAVNFGFEESSTSVTLYFHSAKIGKKIDILKANSKVTFEMDTGHRLLQGESACDCTFLYQSIIGSGIVSFVDDNTEKNHGLSCIMKHYCGKYVNDFSQDMLKNTLVIRLDVTEWTCKQHI